MTEGVVYIATADKFVQEAVTSARSINEKNPEISIGLITSEKCKYKIIDDTNVFNDYVIVDKIHDDIRDKCFNIHQTPYDRTLYLDTDTYICGDISDMFSLLDSFDFAITHAPVRESNKLENIPDNFPDPNGGVLLFRSNEVVNQILNNWEKYYREQISSEISQYPKHDQATLRRALFESDAKVTVLPPQYNCRFIFPGYIEGTVKILHGTDRDLSTICGIINKYDRMRIHTGQLDRSILVPREGLLKYIPGLSMKKISYPTGRLEHRLRGMWERFL